MANAALCKLNNDGVWDFGNLILAEPTSSEPDYRRWLKIFREIESKNWIIYSNWLYRFFSGGSFLR